MEFLSVLVAKLQENERDEVLAIFQMFWKFSLRFMWLCIFKEHDRYWDISHDGKTF